MGQNITIITFLWKLWQYENFVSQYENYINSSNQHQHFYSFCNNNLMLQLKNVCKISEILNNFIHSKSIWNDALTLAGRYMCIPGVIAIRCLPADSCALANQTIPTITGPAYLTVQVASCLTADGAMQRGIWGAAVQSCTSTQTDRKKENPISSLIIS